MLQKISRVLVNKLELLDAFSKEDREIYLYGVQRFLMLLLNIVSMLIIGALFHQIFQCALYMVLFIPLRTYAGGYHACSPQRCYVYSIACVVAAMILIRQDIISDFVYYGIALACIFIIYVMVPVADYNKPLDDVEIIHYRVHARFVLVLEGLFLVISWLLRWKIGVICVSLSFITLSLMLIAGIIKNKRLQSKGIL